MSAPLHVRVSEEPLSLEALARAVSRPGAGAIVVFCGVTREVVSLDYEAYREMAHTRLSQIAERCLVRHGLQAAAVEHRLGEVVLGEPSVIVAVSAAHRAEAFAGAREIIDRVKAEAPIWKREIGADGSARSVRGEPPVSLPFPASDAHYGGLTHIDGDGSARMVDVGAKEPRDRRARARARVRMSPACAAAIQRGDAPKGEVLGTARLAGVQAAKQTGTLIPLAHPIELSAIDVDASVDAAAGLVELTAEVRAIARTGVEMEAMTACSVAALTVYDMVKGLERGVELEQIVLLEKTGGRRDWRRSEPPESLAASAPAALPGPADGPSGPADGPSGAANGPNGGVGRRS